jgi:hypothetical protein
VLLASLAEATATTANNKNEIVNNLSVFMAIKF